MMTNVKHQHSPTSLDLCGLYGKLIINTKGVENLCIIKRLLRDAT